MELMWEIVKEGGALGVTAVFAVYIAAQNRALGERNDDLVDKQIELTGQYKELSAKTHAAIDRLAERLASRRA